MIDRPAWAEVNLFAITHNVQCLMAGLDSSVNFCAVVKANGYGHGAAQVARAALAGGASWMAVAFAEEGIELRKAGLTCPILILGHTGDESLHGAIGWDLDITVISTASAVLASKAAQRVGKTARVHLKVDTGMNRLGVPASDAASAAAQVRSLSGLELVGISSHLADADAADHSFARQQLGLFNMALQSMELEGIDPGLRHIANSAAALYLPEAHFDMVRVGIAMYGLRASHERASPFSPIPAMSLKARVSQVRHVDAGTPVGYGQAFVTDRPSRIAVLPLGYADGLQRALSGRGRVCFGKGWAPIVGRICMDQLMVDVTDLPEVQDGDEAIVFGTGGPPLAELADLLGTIDYELCSAIRQRVPRIYSERKPPMKDTEFRKYHSLGNDYLVVDPAFLPVPPTVTAVQAICDRTYGIGADGLLIGPLRDGSGLDLRIYNPDGSEAEKSGNGLMIYAWHLHERGMSSQAAFPLATQGGTVRAQITNPLDRIVCIDMGEFTFDARSMDLHTDAVELVGMDLVFDGRSFNTTCVSVGNPHCALIMEKVTAGNARFMGPAIEHHELFPHRANVVFLEVLDRGTIKIEIWERGAGYTLASGTSACAAAAVARRQNLVDNHVAVRMPGGDIDIRLDGQRVFMTGTVEPVFQGQFSPALRARILAGSPTGFTGTPTGSTGALAGTPTGSTGALAGTPTGSTGALAGTPTGSTGALTGTPSGSFGTPPC
jgi:alanine racemase